MIHKKDFENFDLTVFFYNNFLGETLSVRISWDEYRDKIVDYGHIKIYAMATVQETKQSWSEEEDFQLEKPKLDVQVIERNSHISPYICDRNRLLILLFRSVATLKLAKTASSLSASWTPSLLHWPSASSPSKDLAWFAPRLWNTGEFQIWN